LICVLLLIAAIPVLAQNRNAGEIRGTVLDTTGAVVPGVTVEARNVDTGVVTSATTVDAGVYDIPWVPTGMYSVTFTKTGFEKVIRDNVDIHVGMVTVGRKPAIRQ
jgi:hypothetical protein